MSPVDVRGGSGFGVTALTLGIIGLFLALVPYATVAGALLGALALVFGLVGRSRTKRDLATGEGMAVAGVSLSVVALATSLTVHNRPPHPSQRLGQSPPATSSSLSLPTSSSVPPPGPKKILLKASGDTVGNTDEFTTTQDWDITWSYDCAGSRYFPTTSFSVYAMHDYKDQILMPGRITKKDSGVQHMHAVGTFSLSVSSLCPWQVTVTG